MACLMSYEVETIWGFSYISGNSSGISVVVVMLCISLL